MGKTGKSTQKKRGGSTMPDGQLSAHLWEADICSRIWPLVEPICESEGMELVHVEFRREPGGRVLRLYIDKGTGVTLDDCVAISRQAGDLLDAAMDDHRIGPYRLEVSSPGPDRPLGRLEDYNRFKGHQAKIRTLHPINGQRNFTGILKGADQDSIQIEIGEQLVVIPFEEITRARLVNHDGEYQC